MKTVLFLSEAVTWSQVVRLLTLANGLDRSRFEPVFAASSFDPVLFGSTKLRRERISSVTQRHVEQRVRYGLRIYDRRRLTEYVREELALFEKIRPDVVVGDLRWSTTVSAPVAGVPLVSLVDAYWFRPFVEYPVPDHPLIRWLGVSPHVQRGFGDVLPHVMRHFAAPVSDVRRAFGLPAFDDLRDVLAFGDRLIFPDDPAVVDSDRPGTFLGPVLWSPDVPMPVWWSEVGVDRPLVYVTMGSSGALDVLPKVLAALEKLDVDIVCATAGRTRAVASSRARFVEAIRGDEAAARASLVVCNGGAGTAWQAIACGTPVLGIPANLDACLAMSCVAAAGGGITLRPEASALAVRRAAGELLTSPAFRARAGELAVSASKLDPHARFSALLDSLGAHGSSRAKAS